MQTTTRTLTLAVGAAVAFAVPAHAGFVGYIVTAIDVELDGKSLTVYTVAARFDGPKDTVLLVHRMQSSNPRNFTGFWHRDAATLGDAEGDAPLRQDTGTWDPAKLVRPKVNREFDSYLTIGGEGNARNTTVADPSWAKPCQPGADPDTRGWHRPDIPASGIVGWFAPAGAAGGQSRVGASPNYTVNGKPTLLNSSTDVRLAQFVLSKDDAPRDFTLTIAFNDGAPESPLVSATADFILRHPNLDELPAAGIAAPPKP